MKTILRTLRKAARACGVDVIRYQDPWRHMPWDFDNETAETVRAVSQHTMTTPARIFTLCEAVRYVVKKDLPGAIVECGVWRGGSMMAVARTLLGVGRRLPDLYLFDTFEGMTAPTDRDVTVDGTPAVDYFGSDGRHAGGELPWLPESVEGVRHAVLSTGYPQERCHLVKGRVEETVPAHAPEEIALLRLDTDWYESTLHELTHLFPRIVDGGVLILDDYGYWKGARQAVDEYLQKNGISLLLTRVDESCRMAVVTKSR